MEGLFAWWWDLKIERYPETCIADVAALEFDLYRHHLRDPSEHNGWLRNMLYSLIQQVMRQDPLYYRYYVLLRPDQQWRLISYPYYTKYTVPGDSTRFTHIDINISRALDEQRSESSQVRGITEKGNLETK